MSKKLEFSLNDDGNHGIELLVENESAEEPPEDGDGATAIMPEFVFMNEWTKNNFDVVNTPIYEWEQ